MLDPAWASMTEANFDPFCSSKIFLAPEVLPLKNASQTAVICATAAELPPVLGVAELAAEDEAGAEVAGVLEAEVEADVLELLLHAATVRARARASVGARAIRRAKRLNRMTRLLSLGRSTAETRPFRAELSACSPVCTECFPRCGWLPVAGRRRRQGRPDRYRHATRWCRVYQRKCTNTRPKFFESFSSR